MQLFRKQPDEDPTVHPNSLLSSRDSTGSSRSLFSLSKALSTSNSSVQISDVKGPLGLTLLYAPEVSEIDFIFVHGLGGGSRKTWSKSSLETHFWPKQWLPDDPAFTNVRIHTYGYDSDYLKGRQDCLNVHHIGKSFLGAMSTLPCIANSKTPIVIVGHSMGGLVMKKAYLLATQDPAHKELAARVTSLYFLGTPHRGSESARMLKNVLKVAYDRAYVSDLEPNSAAIQVINDEFRHVSLSLELWSFYETQNMKYFSSLIVPPESATLGYREEKQIPMTADHRSICKFDTPEDSNYAILRNALASTVKKLATGIPEAKLKKRRERMIKLKEFLDPNNPLEDEFVTVREARIYGSCEWILTKENFIKWRDGKSAADRMLLIMGKPATGKSVLAGYIIDQLVESGKECSYFFFKHADKWKSDLGRCLRSLAFQMASCNDKVGDTVLDMKANMVSLDHVDERTLWRILFTSGIFETLDNQHYWIIDALDESSNFSAFFRSIISSIGDTCPLRILITGRDTLGTEQNLSAVAPYPIQFLIISAADTEPDIRLLVERRIQALRVVEPQDRGSLSQKILDNANGSFLWTTLVLDELLHCHGKAQINQVLQDVPIGMESLYKRTLDSMSYAARGKELAKSILMWAVYAIQPMTISELGGALALEMHDSFPKLQETISALCGQLVVVDNYGRVKMVHETAREFFISHRHESEFCTTNANANTRMAHTCLRYLTGQQMRPPRNSRGRSLAKYLATRDDFATYTYTAFSYHLSRADPRATQTFELVLQFLKSNVITWIETIAYTRNLSNLIAAAKHLKTYTDSCIMGHSDSDFDIERLRQWTNDLARIPAKFGNALMVSPSAIYSVIPPFCPTESTLFNTKGSGRRLYVQGATNTQWDDRVLCTNFRQGQPRVVRYGDQFLAVGLSSGTVVLYWTTSYQEYMILEHGKRVSFIAFKPQSDLLATCDYAKIKVWDIRTGKVVHSLASPPYPLGMEYDGERLVLASRNNCLTTWKFAQDAPPESVENSWSDRDTLKTNRPPPQGTPCALAISTTHGALAVAYSWQPIMLWDMIEDTYAGSCGKKTSNGETCTHAVVASLVFNPNPDVPLLAVSYRDGDLALLDPFADQELQRFRTECQTLAASPNGRFLAAGGPNGVINIYEFATLKLLYRVKSSNSFINQFSFDRDSLRLADIQRSQCTVWEPDILLLESLGEDKSKSNVTTVVGRSSTKTNSKITAMAVHHTSEVVFCGRDDGSLVLYEQKTAKCLGTLYNHKAPISLLVWVKQKEGLLSIDASSLMLLHRVQKKGDGTWQGAPILFQSRLDSMHAIMDVLVEETGNKLIVSTRESDHLFDLNNGKCEKERSCAQDSGSRKWLSHPASSLHLVCIDNLRVSTYHWKNWPKLLSCGSLLDNDKAELRDAFFYSIRENHGILLDFADALGTFNAHKIAIVDAEWLNAKGNKPNCPCENQLNAVATSGQPDARQEAKNVTASSSYTSPVGSHITIELGIAHIIGIASSKRLVYLNLSFWVCSVDIGDDGLGVMQRQVISEIEIFEHFFIPYDWLAGQKDIVCGIVNRDIMFARGNDIAVIRGGLDNVERICLQKMI